MQLHFTESFCDLRYVRASLVMCLMLACPMVQQTGKIIPDTIFKHVYSLQQVVGN